MNVVISRRGGLVVAGGFVIGLIIVLGLKLFVWSGREEMTDDSYVAADFTLVAPKVSGTIEQVLVDDNEEVKSGQILAIIERQDFLTAVRSTEADVVAAQARVENTRADIERQQAMIAQAKAEISARDAEYIYAKHELNRYNVLAKQGAGTIQNAQHARSRIGTAKAYLERAQAAWVAAKRQLGVLQALESEAEASLHQKIAEHEQAKLNLAYTEVKAPIDGRIGRRSVRVGAYVRPGQMLLAVVPLKDAYVIGNFRETQLTHVVPGQLVSMTVDTFPNVVLRGYVDSLAPATGLTFSPIAPDNATGNFTKIVQRIPVKIRLEPGQSLLNKIRVGMSVVTTIKTDSQERERKRKETLL
ncbi:HlyD family secretion protein [Pseudomonas aeruginosa]|uniref:HlyD family secretion protein n=1 Tax=Pseudomonas aeruginosa TaxID=287 RepID=UPI00068CBA7E